MRNVFAEITVLESSAAHVFLVSLNFPVAFVPAVYVMDMQTSATTRQVFAIAETIPWKIVPGLLQTKRSATKISV